MATKSKTAVKTEAPAKAKKAAVAEATKKRVAFELNASPGIAVAVAGTFNDWDITKKTLSDKNNDGNYRCTMMLPPGTYEYKFYVDNTWCVDPSNPNFTQNELGTLNSVIVVE